MGVSLSRSDVGVSEDFFDIVERHAGVDHRRGKRVSEVMHPDGVDVGCLSGFVPRVEDLLEGFPSGWVGEEEMALFGNLVVGLLHHNGCSDGLDG